MGGTDVLTDARHVFRIEHNPYMTERPWLLECGVGECQLSEAVSDEELIDHMRTHLEESLVSAGDVHGEEAGRANLDVPELRDDGRERGDWSTRLRHAIRDTGAWDGPSGT